MVKKRKPSSKKKLKWTSIPMFIGEDSFPDEIIKLKKSLEETKRILQNVR